MGYYKMTIVSGYKHGFIELTAPVGTNERHAQIKTNLTRYCVMVLRGHWNPASAAKAARRAGVVGNVSITHSTADMSGKGCGGYDAAFIVDADGAVRARPLSRYERDYDDGADVNAVYDAAEGR